MCKNQGMSAAAKSAPGPLTMEIASILRGQIAKQQLVRDRIAADVGISAPQMSKILNGHKQIDIELLEAICDSVGLPLMKVLSDAEEATGARRLSR